MIRETSSTGARSNLASLMDQVADTHEPVVIRRRGKPPVALIAASDPASWMETDYLLRSPANARRLREAITELDAGGGRVMEVAELRARLRLED